MSTQAFPFAVRLIGFTDEEQHAFDAAFLRERETGYAYMRLGEGNLQDPDLYIANAENLKALATLDDLRPGELRPALLVGTPAVDLPYLRIMRPLQWDALFAALRELMEKRADAMARLAASDIVVVPERRRRDRPDLDLNDPREYEKLRARVPEDGCVLVIDRNAILRDYLADLLGREEIAVEWVSDEESAVELCKRSSVAVVLINCAAPGVDPYRLCWAVKEKDAAVRTGVVFLTTEAFVYDLDQARYVGADGFLCKPLLRRHLISVLKKFLPRVR